MLALSLSFFISSQTYLHVHHLSLYEELLQTRCRRLFFLAKVKVPLPGRLVAWELRDVSQTKPVAGG